MVPIKINISDVVKEFSLNGEELKKILIVTITSELEEEWTNQVNNLKKSRAEYKRAMSIYTETSSIIIELSERKSKLALMLEEGASPFDIKKGFELSPQKTEKKDGGWYLTVPFRWSTPETLGESEAFSNSIPKNLYKKISKEGYIKFDDLSQNQRILGIRQYIEGFDTYEHKSPLAQGLTKTSKVKNQGVYHTFRRVSDRSDPNSWIHKGFKPKKLMDKAISDIQIDDIVSTVVDNYIETSLGN